MLFEGTYTALVTPFRNGEFDKKAFAELIERQIIGGVNGIVPVGTTGESPTLNHEEHHEVICQAIEVAAGRCKVIAGTGSNSTAEAVSLTKAARAAGADAALLVAPYYNKPSQEGLFRHYKTIADQVDIPIILYNIPGRCVIEIAAETCLRLVEACPNIRTIKEAGGSVERVSHLKSLLPDDVTILSGDDSLTLPFLSVGAKGIISVASNLIPAEVSELVNSFLQGNPTRSAELHTRFYPLFKNLFIEPNPVPIKYAMAKRGWIDPEVRLPLCSLSEKNKAVLDAILSRLS
ncbi:MAG: 4-hydroxy-tetrahydrodipicolinate synthase [Chthoniobacterales bacterium]